MKTTIRNLFIIAVIGLAGCDESEVEGWSDEASEEEPSFRSIVYNDTVLNGIMFNGTLLNGTLLNTNVLLTTPNDNLVQNGGFDGCTGLHSNAPAIPGWTITGLVDWWLPSPLDGCAVDLAGSPGPGKISQFVATTVGLKYELVVDVRLNDYLGPQPRPITLAAGSAVLNQMVGMQRETLRLEFTATATRTKIELGTTEPGRAGPYVDNVAVRRVEDPMSADSTILRGFNHPVYSSQGSLSMGSDGNLVYNNPSANVVNHKGAQLVGMTLNYDVRRNGVLEAIEVRIVSHATDSNSWGTYPIYNLQMRKSGGLWQDLCLDGAGNPTAAVILDAQWNSATGAQWSKGTNIATFACQGTALAKCVKFGYVPWSTSSGDLSSMHQACTRMVRADYCGNGIAHTVANTQIHVLDTLGIQKQSATSYAVEAEWGPRGATCLNPNNTRLANQTIGCPIPTCGPSFASGGIIQSGKILSGGP